MNAHWSLRPWFGVAIGLAVGLATAPAAHAHEAAGAGGFGTGFGHPISGWDHVAAMLAVGLWGAQMGSPWLWVLPVVFPVVMAVGGALALAGVPLPGVEVGIALSALALGLLVLAEARTRPWIAAFVVGAFALFHGHAHGTELPEGQDGLLYSLGFVVGTGCLHAAGIGVGQVHRWPAGRIAVRVLGGLIALAGGWFLWSALR